MKIIAKVPENTVPYKFGERLMACEVTEDFKFIHATEFFKTKSEAVIWVNEHLEYKFKNG